MITHVDTLVIARAVLAYPESSVNLKRLAFEYLHRETTTIDLRSRPGGRGRTVRGGMAPGKRPQPSFEPSVRRKATGRKAC